MTAGWDNLVPRWFTRLHPVHGTPVNSILFMAALVLGLILMSMLGVREQESSQLLAIGSSVHYAIVYIALFAIPLFGRTAAPPWLKPIAWGRSAVQRHFAFCRGLSHSRRCEQSPLHCQNRHRPDSGEPHRHPGLPAGQPPVTLRYSVE
jgi:hypothetical protein